MGYSPLRAQAIRNRNRTFAREYLGSVCKQCGGEHNLEFMRKDGSKALVQWHSRSSLETLRAELDKCVLICRDCRYKLLKYRYRLAHPIAHGTVDSYNNHRCRCTACRAAWSDYTRRYRLRRSGVPTPAPLACAVLGCGAEIRYKTAQLCNKHYLRQKRHGDTSKLLQEQHGMRSSSEYISWHTAIQRCFNPADPRYNHYGGRGIVVCALWHGSFGAFFRDVGPKPGSGYSLERINNNGNYSCGHCMECTLNSWSANCKWATTLEQANNMSTNILLSYGGKTQTIAQWARELGMNYHKLYLRITRYKWPVHRAFTE